MAERLGIQALRPGTMQGGDGNGHLEPVVWTKCHPDADLSEAGWRARDQQQRLNGQMSEIARDRPGPKSDCGKVVGTRSRRAEVLPLASACRPHSGTPRASRHAAMSVGASAEPMAVSLSAGMDATRRAARHGANTGIAETARQLIRSVPHNAEC